MNNMKKLLVLLMVLFAIKAYACQIQTYIIDGRIITCTICNNVTTCN